MARIEIKFDSIVGLKFDDTTQVLQKIAELEDMGREEAVKKLVSILQKMYRDDEDDTIIEGVIHW